MSVVVDSSVLVAALVDTGPDGIWAENIVEGGVLYAPELVQVEVTNTLRRLELGKKITLAEANSAYEDLMQLEIELFPFVPSLTASGSCARRSRAMMPGMLPWRRR